jgi:hypothetical protein
MPLVANTLKIICLCYYQFDLTEKRLNTFQFLVIFHYFKNYSGKTEQANDLKFCTSKVISIRLHQMNNNRKKKFPVQSCKKKTSVESL